MSLTPNALRLGCIGLLLLSVLYCLPGHPSAGNVVALDALAHVGVFLGVGLWFGWSGARDLRAFAALAAFAALLEVAQWQLGRFPHVEWADIAANEAGLAMAFAILGWSRRRLPRSEMGRGRGDPPGDR
jgi:VanZ family protein